MLKRSAKYKKIGDRLLQNLPEFEEIKDSSVKIAYLISDEEKRKNHKIVYGECVKVSPRYEWCCHYDFMIIVYEENCAFFNKHQYENLIRHELHHVGIDTEGNEPTFYIVPHDIEEFWELINDEGLDWNTRRE